MHEHIQHSVLKGCEVAAGKTQGWMYLQALPSSQLDLPVIWDFYTQSLTGHSSQQVRGVSTTKLAVQPPVQGVYIWKMTPICKASSGGINFYWFSGAEGQKFMFQRKKKNKKRVKIEYSCFIAWYKKTKKAVWHSSYCFSFNFWPLKSFSLDCVISKTTEQPTYEFSGHLLIIGIQSLWLWHRGLLCW